MIERRPGEMTTLDTRGESHDKVDKQKRYQQILEILELTDFPMTAKEIAVSMYALGYIPLTERNFTAPRLTELCKFGKVEPAGKKKCDFTGRNVTVYRIRRD